MENFCKRFNIECVPAGFTHYAKVEDLERYVFYENCLRNERGATAKLNKRKTVVGGVEYMDLPAITEYVSVLNWHPEHYNAKMYLGIEPAKALSEFKKKYEISYLAPVFEKYRQTYRLVYQYKISTYFLDLAIFLNDNAMVVIEIDEKGHTDRDPGYEQIRDELVRSQLVYLVRVDPTKFDTEQMMAMVDSQINKLRMYVTKDITVEDLQQFLRDETIDKDFYDIIGKGLVARESFTIDFDDIWKYLGYTRKDNAKKKLEKEMLEGVDYVVRLGKIAPAIEGAIKGGQNRETILLSKFAMYHFCIVAQTAKAKECRVKILRVYEAYQNLILKTRDLMIESEARIEAERKGELAKAKAGDALEKKVEVNERIIARLREDIDQYKSLYDDTKMKLDRVELDLKQQNLRMQRYVQERDQIECDLVAEKAKVVQLESDLSKLTRAFGSDLGATLDDIIEFVKQKKSSLPKPPETSTTFDLNATLDDILGDVSLDSPSADKTAADKTATEKSPPIAPAIAGANTTPVVVVMGDNSNNNTIIVHGNVTMSKPAATQPAVVNVPVTVNVSVTNTTNHEVLNYYKYIELDPASETTETKLYNAHRDCYPRSTDTKQKIISAFQTKMIEAKLLTPSAFKAKNKIKGVRVKCT